MSEPEVKPKKEIPIKKLVKNNTEKTDLAIKVPDDVESSYYSIEKPSILHQS